MQKYASCLLENKRSRSQGYIKVPELWQEKVRTSSSARTDARKVGISKTEETEKPSMDMSLENRTRKPRQRKLRQCKYFLA